MPDSVGDPRTWNWTGTYPTGEQAGPVVVLLVEADEKLSALQRRCNDLKAELLNAGHLAASDAVTREHRARSADRP